VVVTHQSGGSKLQMDNRLQRDYHGVVCVFY